MTKLSFTADAQTIADALSRVGKALSKNRQVEILGGVHLMVEKRELTMTATDMDLVLRERVQLDRGRKGFCVALNAPKVLAGLRTLSGPLEFEAKDENLLVRNGTTSLRFPIGPVLDYPATRFEHGPELEVDREAFLSAFATVGVCASTDESRPVLGAIRLEQKDGRLFLISTDSYRLGVDSFEIPKSDFLPMSVQSSALTRVLRLAEKGEGPLYLSQTIEKHGNTEVAIRLRVRDGEREAFMRYVQGTFPSWRQLTPDGFESHITFDKSEGEKAIARFTTLIKSNVPMRVVPEDESVCFSIKEQDGVGIETVLPASLDLNDGVHSYGVNPRFFREALLAMTSDTVTLHTKSPLKPYLVTEGGINPNGNVLPRRYHLIMPIRLAG